MKEEIRAHVCDLHTTIFFLYKKAKKFIEFFFNLVYSTCSIPHKCYIQIVNTRNFRSNMEKLVYRAMLSTFRTQANVERS